MRPRALGPLLVVAAAALLLPGQASAHAVLVGSDPADGARLASSPQTIRLWFNEDVSRTLSRVGLTGARTGRVAGVAVRSGSGLTLEVALPKLRRDTYILRWRTVSEDDLHVTGGSLVFGVHTKVGQRPVASASASAAAPGPNRAEVVLRWFDFAAIAGLIGALALIVVCVRQAGRRGATGVADLRRRLAVLASTAAAVAFCTGIGLLVLQAHRLSTGSVTSALGTVLTGMSYGPSWIARELLICLLLVLALVLGRRRPSAQLVVLVAMASLALCSALAFNSHAASTRGQVSLATAVLALHLLSATVWAGGVCALALVLFARVSQARTGEAIPLVLRSFSGVAALSVAVLALSGLYSAGVDVESPNALFTTLYGRTLLAKTALFVVIGMIGLSNSLLVRSGSYRSRRLQHGVRLEAALALGVILLAALLTATAPARETRFVAVRAVESAPVGESTESAQAGDLLVSLSVKPNRPGVNFVTAGVFNTRRPAPAPIRAVEFSIGRRAGHSWLGGSRVRNQYWQLTGNQLDHSGAWSIGIRIRRPGMPEEVVKIPWTLRRTRPQVPPARVLRSEKSLASVLSPAAAAGALVLAVALLLATLRPKGVLVLRRRARSSLRNEPPRRIAPEPHR